MKRIKVGNFFIFRGSILDRCFLASSPDISPTELNEVVNDDRATVRIRAASRCDLSNENVQKLLNDIDRNVRFAILNNERIEISLKLLWAVVDKEDEEEFIWRKALERFIEGPNKEVCSPSIFFVFK